MRSRWFHPPVFHVGAPSVSWLEMLFDLVFVAVLTQLGASLVGRTSEGGLDAVVLYALHITPLAVLWSGSIFHSNLFDVDDVPHRIIVLLQMLAVWAAGLTAPVSMDPVQPDHGPYAISVAALHLTVGLQYLRVWWQTPDARSMARFWTSIYVICGGLWFLSPALPASAVVGVEVLLVVGLALAPLIRAVMVESLTPHSDHITQRYGVLVLLALGGSVVHLLQALNANSLHSLGSALSIGAACLAVATSVWWIYFDDVAGSKIRGGRGAIVVWLYAHLPLIIGISALAPTLASMSSLDFSEPTPPAIRGLLTASLTTILASVAFIDGVTHRRQAELSDRARVNVRFATASLVMLLGIVGGELPAGGLMAVILALSVSQVVFDMLMAPFEHTPISGQSLAEEAQARQASTAPRTPRAIAQPVRQGRPSSTVSNDLYFFFIEGGWIRSILLLTGAFLLINLLFAGLFMLDSASIAGAEQGSLLDAFSFSIQTMSTIGYGALSPGTPYGDVLVTLEAAVGIFFTSLATGLMFAKASRPAANVLFSEVMTLHPRHGVPTLHFRVANARRAEIVDATLSFTVLLDEFSEEGHHLRKLHDLKLVRTRTPLFLMSWTVMHPIDEDSPLRDIDWEDAADALFVVTLIGHDSAYGQTAHAQHMYRGADVRQDVRFVDVMSRLPTGQLAINYDLFHDVQPLTSSSAEPPSADEAPPSEGPPPS